MTIVNTVEEFSEKLNKKEKKIFFKQLKNALNSTPLIISKFPTSHYTVIKSKDVIYVVSKM